MNIRTYHIPVFVPHSGCPHDCVFCNQKRITGQTELMDTEQADKIIKENLETIKRYDKSEKYIEIAFFGGSFTGIEPERQIEYLEIAKKYIDSGDVNAIRCSTRPDYISDDILKMLKSYGVSVIELGVQSTDECVLKASNRGHTYDDVKNACELIKSYGIGLGLQMMTGLCGDTYEKSLKTAMDIAALKPECVRIYPTLVMEDTALYDMYVRGKYTPFGLEYTTELLSDIIKIFESNNINIIRIGLQTTDNVNKKTVIGPYHEAIAELGYARVYRKAIEANMEDEEVIDVTVNPACVSFASGHKKTNKIYFERMGKILKITTDAGLDKKHIIVCNKKVALYENL